MKNLNIYMSLFAIIITISAYSQNSNNGIQEAVEKGKSDLIELLNKTGDQFNFGVKVTDVENSRQASPISYYEMNFSKLLNYTEQQSLRNLLNSEMKKIVPLVRGKRLITTIGVAKKGQEATYKVIELIDHHYHKDLNKLPDAIRAEGFKDLKIVYVPNLNVNVYHFDGKNYTNYNGRSLQTPINDTNLLRMMQKEAAVFQAKFGDQLREQKLLN